MLIYVIQVPHVHMHIIPRKQGDWANNDDIYEELDKKKKGVDNEDRKPRTEQEMSLEANELRLFCGVEKGGRRGGGEGILSLFLFHIPCLFPYFAVEILLGILI